VGKGVVLHCSSVQTIATFVGRKLRYNGMVMMMMVMKSPNAGDVFKFLFSFLLLSCSLVCLLCLLGFVRLLLFFFFVILFSLLHLFLSGAGSSFRFISSTSSTPFLAEKSIVEARCQGFSAPLYLLLFAGGETTDWLAGWIIIVVLVAPLPFFPFLSIFHVRKKGAVWYRLSAGRNVFLFSFFAFPTRRAAGGFDAYAPHI
jgi:hypothetical protein